LIKAGILAYDAAGMHTTIDQGVETNELLRVWRWERGPGAMAACVHPVVCWFKSDIWVRCCKCGWRIEGNIL